MQFAHGSNSGTMQLKTWAFAQFQDADPTQASRFIPKKDNPNAGRLPGWPPSALRESERPATRLGNQEVAEDVQLDLPLHGVGIAEIGVE